MSTCGPGEELSQGFCYPSCPQGHKGSGPICSKNCPDGFIDVGTSCVKPSMSRPNGQMPYLSSCAPGLRDDGNHCWADQKCTYIKNEMNQIVLSCTGCGCIRQTKAERQTCPVGFEVQNNLCYPKCYTGYTSVGTKCVANCPNGFTDIGTVCVKPTTVRKAGSMHSNGLKSVTDDPRKSTLALRSQLSQLQVDANKAKGFSMILGNTDAVTAAFAAINSSSPTISSLIKSVTSSSGILSWIIVAVIAIVTIGFTPGGSAVLTGIGSAISSVSGAFQSAVTSVGQIAVDAADVSKSVITDAATIATEAAKPIIETVGTGLETVANVASQQATETVNALTS